MPQNSASTAMILPTVFLFFHSQIAQAEPAAPFYYGWASVSARTPYPTVIAEAPAATTPYPQDPTYLPVYHQIKNLVSKHLYGLDRYDHQNHGYEHEQRHAAYPTILHAHHAHHSHHRGSSTPVTSPAPTPVALYDYEDILKRDLESGNVDAEPPSFSTPEIPAVTSDGAIDPVVTVAVDTEDGTSDKGDVDVSEGEDTVNGDEGVEVGFEHEDDEDEDDEDGSISTVTATLASATAPALPEPSNMKDSVSVHDNENETDGGAGADATESVDNSSEDALDTDIANADDDDAPPEETNAADVDPPTSDDDDDDANDDVEAPTITTATLLKPMSGPAHLASAAATATWISVPSSAFSAKTDPSSYEAGMADGLRAGFKQGFEAGVNEAAMKNAGTADADDDTVRGNRGDDEDNGGDRGDDEVFKMLEGENEDDDAGNSSDLTADTGEGAGDDFGEEDNDEAVNAEANYTADEGDDGAESGQEAEPGADEGDDDEAESDA